MRQMLVEKSEQLFDYYLVNRFNHAKLETAVSDIAKEILSDELLEFCLVKNNKYDKNPHEQVSSTTQSSDLKCLGVFLHNDPCQLRVNK